MAYRINARSNCVHQVSNLWQSNRARNNNEMVICNNPWIRIHEAISLNYIFEYFEQFDERGSARICLQVSYYLFTTQYSPLLTKSITGLPLHVASFHVNIFVLLHQSFHIQRVWKNNNHYCKIFDYKTNNFHRNV